MRLRNVTALCVVLFASVAGCHPAVAPRGSDDEKAAACSEHLRAASDPMSAAIAGHQDCATDADCVLVPFGAACFDACTRVMSRNGAAAYEKARGDTATPCAAYQETGCPRPVPPPCAPNPPPSCKAGRCG